MEKVSITVELKEKISSELKKMVSGFAKVADTVYDLHKHLTKTNEEVENLNSISLKLNMPNLNAILDVADKISEVFVNASESGMAFEQSIADLQSITGIAGKDLESLTENCRRLGVESGLGAAEAARSYSLLASQIEISKIGMEGLNSLQEKAITLAQASGMSMAASANALAGTINQFGLSAEEADRVINVLAAGSKYGAAEIEDLSQSFKVVGAAASAMGLTVESTAGALEILSQANLKGSEAGTALRNIILKLNTELGVDLGETSLSKALEDLKPKLSDAAYLSKVFGMENIAAAQFLIQNAEAVDEMTAQLTDTNVAHEQAAIRTETNAHKLAQMRAQVEDLKIAMADWLGGMAPLLTVLSENAVALLTFAKAIQLAGKSSLVAAIHEKVQTLALKLLTSSSWFASAGMGALTAATIALYAALTLGISLVVTGIVAAFSALGDEAEEASAGLDVLKESEDAFKNTVSQTAAELEMEKAALKELIKENKDATDKVSALNAKYGEAFGYHKTAIEWYDTLVAKSKVYCQQLGYEAQAKVLASQIAAKELEKEAKQTEMKNLEDSGAHLKVSYVVTGTGSMPGELMHDRKIVETKEYTDAKRAVASLDGELTQLRATWDTCINKMAEAGKALADTTNESNATSEALNWQTMSYADLKNAIEVQEKAVAKYAGVDSKRATTESALLAKMKNRYKQLGQSYGLDNSGGENARSTADSRRNAVARAVESYDESYKEALKNMQSQTADLGVEAIEDATEKEIEQINRDAQRKRDALDESIAGLVKKRKERDKALWLSQETSRKEADWKPTKSDAEYKGDILGENGGALMAQYEAALAAIKAEQTRKTAQAKGENIEPIDELKTYELLSNAIGYYEEKQKRASASESLAIAKTIEALKRKRDAMAGLWDLPGMETQIAELGKLPEAKLRVKLEAIGAEGIQGIIEELKKMLEMEDLTEDQKKSINSLIGKWAEYYKELGKMTVTEQAAVGFGYMGQAMQSLGSVVSGAGGAWIEYAANVANAISQAIPQIAALVTANEAQATAGAVAQSQSVPFPLNIIALTASLAAVGAAIASIPKFADGGIAYGPTLGLFGEYAGAGSNPEVVAPLDRLRSLMGVDEPGNGRGGKVKFIIEGRTLAGILEKTERIKRRTE